MKKHTYKILGALFTVLLLDTSLSAQSTDNGFEMSSATAFYIVSGFVLLVAILVLIVSIVVLQVLRVFVERQAKEKVIAEGVEVIKEKNWWQKFLTRANDAVPVEEEETIVLDHNYDGIRELDNHLPPWWKWLFYATIIFAVIYLAAYHVFDSLPLSAEEYEMAMTEAEEARLARLAGQPVKNIDEDNVEFVTDESSLAKGKQIFNLNCQQCHKEDGGGGIGPNLTDKYWLHGGSVRDIFRTIKVGVPEKGMISWEPLLSPEQMQNVASFVMTLRGTTPANPKGPQGELYVPEENNSEGNGEGITDSTEVVENDSIQMAILN